MDTLLQFLAHGPEAAAPAPLTGTALTAGLVVAAACFSVPLVAARIIRMHPPSSLKRLAWLTSALMLCGGAAELLDLWSLWRADAGLQTLARIGMAAFAVAGALLLWWLMPRLASMPAPSQWQLATETIDLQERLRTHALQMRDESEQALALALGFVDAGLVLADRSGRVTRMSRWAQRLTGWTDPQARGHSLREVLMQTPPAAGKTEDPASLMNELGIPLDASHRLQLTSRGGLRTDVEVRVTLSRSDSGEVRGLAMVLRDVTPLLGAQTDASLLGAIVGSSYDAIIGKTLTGQITSWNQAAQTMFGYTAEEAIGHPVHMLIPPGREAEEMRILTKVSHGERVAPFDTERLTRDGRTLQVSLTVSPIRDAAGRIVGASKIARDVTRQRRAEAALRESEARLRFTVESARIGDWQQDLDTGLVRRSLRHDLCFGYTELQPLWDHDTFLKHLHPDDRAAVEHEFRAAVSEWKDWHIECRVLWPDASTHWISLHGSIPLRHEKTCMLDRGPPQLPRAREMRGIISDITAQKLAESARLKTQQLETENRQIQEANRLKSQFLASMSHELRTPLNAIIGFAELLQSGAVSADSLKHHTFLGHIRTSGRHLLQLINDLLDLSKVESGKFEFFPEALSLSKVVEEVTGILQASIDRKRIRLRMQIHPDVEHLVLDPARLKQVLYNYLSNALKFTPERGKVVVRAEPDGPAHVRIEVADSGIGIAESDLPRLFSEFQQIDGGLTRLHQGTGLGLALTRRLVQAQGGRVGVRSTLGRGSVFHAVLNRVHGVDAAATQAAAPPAGEQPVHRLLVIEHDAQVQARMIGALSEAGFRVDFASSGTEALTQAQGTHYDAITLGLQLPDRGGLGVLGNIRRDGPSRHSQVVGVSMPDLSGRVAAFAVANLLSKPISAGEVAAAMATLRPRHGNSPHVMVIDDDPVALELMRATLATMGIGAVLLQDGQRALREIEQHRPDAIVLDLMMPGFDGFAVLDALQRLGDWRDTPVFIWTSMLLTEDEYLTLSRSASAIHGKGGGALADMLDSLSRWRPAIKLPADGGAA